MEFSYRISPFIHVRYIFYTFRWLLFLLLLLPCFGYTPLEGVPLPLGFVSLYLVLLLSFWAVAFLAALPFSLFIALWQHQAGAVATVILDGEGLTESWRDRQVHIPWRNISRAVVRRRFLLLKARNPQCRWFLFRQSVDKETFLALSQFIRSHTAA